MITAARTFDPAACHYYTKDGKPVHTVPSKSNGGQRPTTVADCRKLGLLPSPTTILKLLHRPALESWKIEQAVLATLTAPRRDGEDLDAFVKRILHTDEEQNQERDAAAQKGKAIHAALQNTFATGHTSYKWREYVEPVEKVVRSLGFTVATEQVIIADDYAGMTDLIVKDDTVWDIDFKTCRNIPDAPYREHKLQVAAYGGAIPGCTHCAVIYISTTNPGEIKVCDLGDWSNDLKAFTLLVQFWRTINNMETK